MNRVLSVFIAGASLSLLACGTDTAKTAELNSRDSVLAPVETKAPNTDYKPAFAGQTRAAGVKTTISYTVKALSSGLSSPWGITCLPDGRFLITEKGGQMRIATNTGSLSEPITGIPAVNADGQGGLLGLCLDPAFAQNRMLYWVFAEKTADGNLTAVGKGRLAADEKSIEQASTIYRALPAYKGSLHYGGRIVFDASGNLFVSTGERSDLATRPLAQDLGAALGKVVHITTSGAPVAGNPFEANKAARPELYSYGHRNVQGLAFHPQTGGLWESEFGPRGGDELNLIEAGKNYGWPTITYGLEYSGKKVGEGITQQAGLEQPVYYWDPVLSPSGMCFYNSDSIPEWKNNLFIGGLSSQHIARLVIQNNKVVGEERIMEAEGQRVRDVTQGKDGALYAITDQGRLYRVGK